MESLELKKIAAIAAVYKFLEEANIQQVEYAVSEEVSAWKTGSRMMNLQTTQIRNQLR
jgi:hypothetical protein